MIKVAVIVLTYRRPHGLDRVLKSLDAQKYIGEVPYLTAIVIDNDVQPTASNVVNDFITQHKLNVTYVHESSQGIPIARNRGLDAVPEDFDFFCFIDDDEWPTETWIDCLLKTQQLNNADCVLGAVIPVYPETAPQWIIKSRVFDSWRFPDNARLQEAASNNVLISYKFVKKHNLRFDERMRMTGGSDYLFFKQANQKGMRIFWSDSAPVYEEVPLSRLSFRWITQRQYRLGNTFSVSERLAGTKFGLIALAVKGLLRVGLGIFMLPSIILSCHLGMKGISHILRGAGTFAGVFGHSHQEYSTKSLAKDRRNNQT